MSAPLAVIFDIDDTLYLERDYARSGFAAVGVWAADWIDAGFGALCLELFEQGVRGSIFDAALRRLGWEPAPELVGAMIECYRTHRPRIELAPDARAVLDALRERAIPIGAITDGPPASQSRKAHALGLARYAKPIVLTGLFGQPCAKPAPWAFERVAEAIQAEQFVYVGDNPKKDFTTPKKMGWKTVRIRREGGLHCAVPSPEPGPDFEFPDCSALALLINRWLDERPASSSAPQKENA